MPLPDSVNVDSMKNDLAFLPYLLWNDLVFE